MDQNSPGRNNKIETYGLGTGFAFAKLFCFSETVGPSLDTALKEKFWFLFADGKSAKSIILSCVLKSYITIKIDIYTKVGHYIFQQFRKILNLKTAQEP